MKIILAVKHQPKLLMLALVFATLFLLWPHAASAQYVENNLVDDTIFLNAASLNQSQIQTFLQNRGGYLASYNSYSGQEGATVPASQIIYDAAQMYGVNPQVIMSMLQKEQSLITATNPTSSQLNFAMGYGCNDSTGCTKYQGLYNQIDNATWQLRMNFERARGNNTWWDSKYTFLCSGTTRYYSTGLYVGRNVTFYDDSGTAYKNFTINDASTSALYCYTPHAYPGSAGEYFSGSYNFVVAFEQWFGSTQPSLVVSSPLTVSSDAQGAFAGTPTTATFNLTNNTNSPMVTNMAVTVRASNGSNQDYGLQTLSIPAHSTVIYSSTKTFSAEGTYTFGLTSYSDGIWSDGTPTSSSIDNPRSVTLNLQTMPTITVAPASSVAEMRVGKAATMSFTVKNNSQQSMDVGQIALAVRGPNGENDDLPLVATGAIPADGTYTYSRPFTPPTAGTYTGFITDTNNGGANWNETDFPAQASGVSRTIQFSTKASPTLTQGPTLSITSPHVGQQVITSFKVKNFGDSAVNVGTIGMAIRDPQGRNVDSGSVALTVNANSEYAFQSNTTFQTPGTYTAWITVFRNGAWDDTTYPTPEDGTVARKITFTVSPSPTITVQPVITTSDPRVGKAESATFTLHNYGTQPADAGQMALAVRDPNGKNADFNLQAITISAGGDYVYTATRDGTTFQTPGTYTAWITSFKNGVWDDTTYPASDSSSIARKITFTVSPSPTVTSSVTSNVASPHVGQAFTLSFTIKNFGDTTVNLGNVGLAGRDTAGHNLDPGTVPVTLTSGQEKTVSFTVAAQNAGKINYYIISTNDFRNWGTGPAIESSSVSKSLDVTVTN